MICTKFQGRESVSTNMSSFALDCHQVNTTLALCTEKTLILMDEFGKGTLVNDGLGLLAGVIQYLSNNTRPRSIIVSNYTKVSNNFSLFSLG